MDAPVAKLHDALAIQLPSNSQQALGLTIIAPSFRLSSATLSKQLGSTLYEESLRLISAFSSFLTLASLLPFLIKY